MLSRNNTVCNSIVKGNEKKEKKPELFTLVPNLNSDINKLQNKRKIALSWWRVDHTNHFTFFSFLVS